MTESLDRPAPARYQGRMRRPSLTRPMMESLDQSVVHLRAALARSTDANERGHLIRAIGYIEQSVAFKRAQDAAADQS